MNVDPELLAILVCPRCHAPLDPNEVDPAAPTLDCTGADCGLRYPVRDGIPVMLVDDAVPRASA